MRTGIHHTLYYRLGSGMGAPGAIPVRNRYPRGVYRLIPVSCTAFRTPEAEGVIVDFFPFPLRFPLRMVAELH